MKVKKYVAKSMPEAMNQIRKDLGSDAVILNSKVKKSKGLFGFLQKSSIEVIAAADPYLKDQHKKIIKKEIKPKSMVKESFVLTKPETYSKENTQLKNNITGELKSFSPQQDTKNYFYPEPIQLVYQFLLNQELEKIHAQALSESLLERYYVNQKKVDHKLLGKWLLEEVKEILSPYTFGNNGMNNKIIYFVGPTGVGKTTTIAKIAAHAIMNNQKKVALITMDTYRIGAIDQLKTYGKILDVPLEVAYNYSDFVEAKKKLENYDLILVDTAGRNYKQIEFINELRENIETNVAHDMYLVLSATTKYRDVKRMYQQFSSFEINKVIFTKLDEISEYGPIINLILDCHVGVSYMTNGQNVPDDFIVASEEKIASLIVGEWKNE